MLDYAMAYNKEQPIKLCSHPSDRKVKALFCNNTSRDISIEWLNFTGDHVPGSRRLRPKQGVPITTYVGHPWVFYETDTRHPLVTMPQGQRVYFPEETEGANQTIVSITNPLLSLKQSSLNFLHRHIVTSSGCNTQEDFLRRIQQLPLPPSLIRDLTELSYEQHNENLPIYIKPSEE